MVMNLMHECPHCGNFTDADPWHLARGGAIVCTTCASSTVPSREVRRTACKLLRIRRAVELERMSAAKNGKGLTG